MRRREFIKLLGGAAYMPLAAHAQQSGLPVIGFLSSRTEEQARYLVSAFHDGLRDGGYVEGTNVSIAYRYAKGDYSLLPGLAANLVSGRVAVLVAGGTSGPASAATTTIPIVFTSGFDPAAVGLVKDLNKPEGNLTGATFYSGALGAKQIGILRELAPNTARLGVLVNPLSVSVSAQLRDMQAAARAGRLDLNVLNASTEIEIEKAFQTLSSLSNTALLVSVDPLFDSRPNQLTEFAARYSLPAIYYMREFIEVGGLVSYGASLTDTYRRAGIYTARILKGARPSELPIEFPTRFELAINLRTAKTLGLTISPGLLASADEVID